MKSDPNQSRLKTAEKVFKYLFSPLQFTDPTLDLSLKASGNIVSKYVWLYWAIYGTKEERSAYSGIYRPKLGMEFAKQKVDLLMLKLTKDEEATLSSDIDQIISLVKAKDYPKDSVQIPVNLTGHPGIEPSFGTAFFSGMASMDWGLGGSIVTLSGKSYLIHVLELIKLKLSPSAVEKLSDQEIKSLYFFGRPYVKPEPPSPNAKSRFSQKAFDYGTFLRSIGRGDK